MMAAMATAEYRHHIEFRAVARAKDRRTGNPVGPMLGHHYRLGLVFVGPVSLLHPESDPGVREIIDFATGWIREHWDGEDLTRQRTNTGPLDLCWYLTEVLNGRVRVPGVLSAVSLTVDGQDTVTFWPDKPDAAR